MTWLPMRDLFTGHDPDTFDDLIEAERSMGRTADESGNTAP